MPHIDGISQKAKRLSNSRHVQIGSKDSHLVRTEQGQHHDKIHIEEEEHSYGPIKAPGSDPSYRMISSFLGIQRHLHGVQSPPSRYVCNWSNRESPHLHVTHSRSHGVEGGCFSEPIGQPKGLCFLSIHSFEADLVKGDAFSQSSLDIGGSTLVRKEMIPKPS